MRLLDGNRIRDELLLEVAQGVKALGAPPRLTVVQVGADPASTVYIRNKVKACALTGVIGEHRQLPIDLDQSALEAELARLSAGPADGVILQLPLPPGLSAGAAMLQLDPDKDVDGFHPVNLGRLLAGLPGFVPCTPAGIRELLRRSEVPIRGRHVVVLGRSLIVGKPTALLFLEKHLLGDATVTVCHSASRDLPALCRLADILVAAVGSPELVKADWVREGVVVVDVGMNRVDDPAAPRGYRLVGDCDFAGIAAKAAAITPVPGGVGPLTVAMLLKNTLLACRRRRGLPEA